MQRRVTHTFGRRDSATHCDHRTSARGRLGSQPGALPPARRTRAASPTPPARPQAVETFTEAPAPARALLQRVADFSFVARPMQACRGRKAADRAFSLRFTLPPVVSVLPAPQTARLCGAAMADDAGVLKQQQEPGPPPLALLCRVAY
jgi:hypothetical protein